MVMAESPKNYEQWLALSDADKKEIHFNVWNVYKREGIGFAYAAAGRLAAQSPYRVFDLKIGTYHGGEYLLEIEVHPDDILIAPDWFKEKSDGFRVVYQAASHLVWERIVERAMKCPSCQKPYQDDGEGSAGMGKDGGYVANCPNCHSAHWYDPEFNLTESL